MRVKNQKRLEQIRDLISNEGYCSVEKLAVTLFASAATIRRDLIDLEEEGFVIRTHGGAYPKHPQLTNYATRDSINHQIKVAIARKAMEFIEEGDTIYLDPGTTLEQLSLQIRDQLVHQRLTIITPSLNAFVHLSECENKQLILLGGNYKAVTKSFVGPTTLRSINDLMIDKYFMSTAGVVADYGLTDSSQDDCEIKKEVLARVREVILLLDSSKFNARGLFLTAPLGRISRVVTDAGIPDLAAEHMRAAGCEPVIVG